MPTLSQRKLELVATKAAARSNDPTRHKCFVSYHQDDEAKVEKFIDDYGDIFIAKALGVSDEDDFIDSTDTAPQADLRRILPCRLGITPRFLE